MFFRANREMRLLKAFQTLFFDEKHELKPEGKIVLAFLRDEAGARGELGLGGRPYFYDNNNRFDAHSAAFLLGKRRVFDLVVKYLALEERQVFALMNEERRENEEVRRELEV